MSLGLTASASATDAVIYKKMFRADMTALIISYEEMNDIMAIIKYPEESGFQVKGVSQTMKNEEKEQNGGFFGMLLIYQEIY